MPRHKSAGAARSHAAARAAVHSNSNFLYLSLLALFLSLAALLSLPRMAGAQASPPTVEVLNDRRAQLSLNGEWRFRPAEGGEDAEVGTLGRIRIPGSWTRNIISKGEGPGWNEFGEKTARVWYERKITVPESWKGRAVLLELQRVSTDAEVFVNGRPAGVVNWPGGVVDLTEFVTPGEEADLGIRVVAVDDETQVVNYMGHDQVSVHDAELSSRGITGSVVLFSRPKGAHVSDIFVQPSVREKQVTLDVEFADVKAPGPVQLQARMLNEKGETEKTFTETVNLSAAKTQTVRVSWPWKNPRLWDIGQPNLYTLQLSAKGAGLNDEYPQAFGFREFWIDGRKFYLNGTEIRLRPHVFTEWDDGRGDQQKIDARFDDLEKRGFNIAEVWPSDMGRRGSIHYNEPIYNTADKRGMGIMGNALSFTSYLSGPNWTTHRWEEVPERKAKYQRMLEMEFKRNRNHPSILMWASSANSYGHDLDQDPRFIGKKDYSSVQEFQIRYEEALKAIGMMKALDPTRPVFTHHGSYVGDLHSVNMYLNLIPLQEREEWLSEWVKNGDLPFMPIEFGTPLYSTMMRGRDGYGNTGRSEPLMTEYTSIYFGNDAYKKETPAYRNAIRDRFKGGQEYDWFGIPELQQAPAFQDLQNLFVTNTWRSWRTAGITGGMVPWENAHGTPAVEANNQPTLAWIAGHRKAFTDKDHSFRAGERVEKQIALLNDHRSPQPYEATWSVTVDGKTVFNETKRGKLAVAETKLLPFTFRLPRDISGGKVDGEIKLTATVGQNRHEDTFPFRVFAPVKESRGVVTAFDPEGETTRLLKSLGYTVKPWQEGVRPEGVLVVGRKALSEKRDLPFDLSEFVETGGRAIVFAQDPNWMQHALGLRTAPHLARRAFRVNDDHPVVQGLDAADLRDWRGSSELVEAYPEHKNYEGYPKYGWHWGNRGAVSSAPIEKPHRSSWRPILETEFDLAYTPLMEMEYGKGRITFTTLDLEDHADEDPAARRLAIQLMEYVANAPLSPKVDGVLYIGADEGAALLNELGVTFINGSKRPDLLPLLAQSNLLIIGPQRGAGSDLALLTEEQIKEYLEKGGKVVFLPQHQENGYLGVKLEKKSDFNGSLNPPSWEEARGLSASDLRWRAPGEAWVISGGEGVEVGADGLIARRTVGKGTALFVQTDPASIPADEKTYLRFTRWRQTRALSQLLANMGARFVQDDRIMALLEKPDHPYFLAGEWDAKMTYRKDESPKREWNSDPGMTEAAKALVRVDAPDTGWEKQPVPAYMESYGGEWKNADGEVVFRKVVDIPARFAGRDLFLSVGRVDETDFTYFNGEKIGETKDWFKPRGYTVPGRLVKPGKNVIAVRVYDQGIHGGMAGGPEMLYLAVKGEPTGFYHDDYIPDYDLEDRKYADNPYRYYRW